MQFEDVAPLTGVRKTSAGYLVADVLCARTGCQEYLAREIGLKGDDVVNVYRPEAAVFDKQSMATFAGKPVTLDHPPVPVDADNWANFAVGDIGEDIARDGEFIRVPIKIMDGSAIKSIESGTREISMGYHTPTSIEDGVAPDGTPYQAIQTGPIIINHLAIVDKARGGENLRIGDTAKKWGAAPITNADRRNDTMSEALRTVVVDGLQVKTTDEGATAIQKLQKALTDTNEAAEQQLADNAQKIKDLESDIEKKKGEIDALKKSAEDQKITPDKLQSLIDNRFDLMKKAMKLGMSEKEMSGKSEEEIRRMIVAKKMGEDRVKDMSADAVIGAFEVLADASSEAPFDPIQQTLNSGVQAHDGANAWTDKVLKSAGVTIKEAS